MPSGLFDDEKVVEGYDPGRKCGFQGGLYDDEIYND
jgi:hypothetical protein